MILYHFTHSELDAIKSSAFLNGFCCAGAVFLWLTLLGLLLWSLFP